MESKARHSAGEIFRNPVYLLAYGFGSGLAPRAPGTAGTLVGVVIYLLLTPAPLWLYALVTVLLLAGGIFVSGHTARKLGIEDPHAVNLDEVVGYLVTMTAVPHRWDTPEAWLWILIGFVLFRFFDILKPWPIRWLDRNIKGGVGIMLDDVAAGIVSGILLYIAFRLLHA
ncbi:MAG: phosphatidylglycerophosphatase A family protein [Gammaproteobacteria bacterium]